MGTKRRGDDLSRMMKCWWRARILEVFSKKAGTVASRHHGYVPGGLGTDIYNMQFCSKEGLPVEVGHLNHMGSSQRTIQKKKKSKGWRTKLWVADWLCEVRGGQSRKSSQGREFKQALLSLGKGRGVGGIPDKGTVCAKAPRLKEHGEGMDHGRLTHNKHGDAQESGPSGANCALWEPVGTGSGWRSLKAIQGLSELGKRELWKQHEEKASLEGPRERGRRKRRKKPCSWPGWWNGPATMPSLEPKGGTGGNDEC